MDRYNSMRELLDAVPPADNYTFHIDRRFHSAVKIFAPHGGCIEPCTSPVALALAAGQYDCFIFNGIRKKECFKTLHVTSSRYDEPQCAEMAAEAEIAVSVHGCNDVDVQLKIGGGNTEAATALTDFLRSRGVNTARPEGDLLGVHHDNFINRAKRGGIQLELSVGLRQRLFPSFPRSSQKDPLQFSSFVDAVREWLATYGRLRA
jgi:phage replication-related protein YjqB (UPF0714/DUF867 family)